MAFNTETAKEAGAKSRRKRDEIRNTLRKYIGDILINDLKPENISKVLNNTSPGMRLKFYADIMRYMLPIAETDEIQISNLTSENINDLINRIQNGEDA